MSSPGDDFGTEQYREDEEYRDDQYADDEDSGWFPTYPSMGWGGAWSAWPLASRRDEDEYDDDVYADANDAQYDDEDDGSLWDEGLISLLLVAGIVLFLFPEPATSGLGILLLTTGVIAWLVDWAL